MRRNIVIGSFLVILFLILLFSISQNSENIKYVKIAGESVKVSLAVTPAEQGKGLSGLSGLSENEGLLFIFDKPGTYRFWMKDMNFPVDIIWINENLEVIYIKRDARPESYPQTFGPQEDAKYVLEVVAGFSDKNNLKEGDSVLFTY